MVEIIDLNRYGVFNWLADSVLGTVWCGSTFASAWNTSGIVYYLVWQVICSHFISLPRDLTLLFWFTTISSTCISLFFPLNFLHSTYWLCSHCPDPQCTISSCVLGCHQCPTIARLNTIIWRNVHDVNNIVIKVLKKHFSSHFTSKWGQGNVTKFKNIFSFKTSDIISNLHYIQWL